MSVTLSSQPRILGLSRSEPPLRAVPPPSPLPSLPSSPLQVKIFEEDFQRERSDRERMNEEKEELKKQVEKLQAQVTLSNAQVRRAGPRKRPLACPRDGGMDCRVPGCEPGCQDPHCFSFQLCYKFLWISGGHAHPAPNPQLCLSTVSFGAFKEQIQGLARSPPLSRRMHLENVNGEAQKQ